VECAGRIGRRQPLALQRFGDLERAAHSRAGHAVVESRWVGQGVLARATGDVTNTPLRWSPPLAVELVEGHQLDVVGLVDLGAIPQDRDVLWEPQVTLQVDDGVVDADGLTTTAVPEPWPVALP